MTLFRGAQVNLSIDQLLPLAVAFIVAISVHEASHALVATLLGDPGPKKEGRLTLNPLRHLDPLGTITIFVIGFGWGRPVGVRPWLFRVGEVTGMALVAFAGPLSNLVTAFVLGLALSAGLVPGGAITTVVQMTIFINVLLAIFNLIPLPPLDGFSVLMRILPPPLAMRIAPIAKYGPGVLLAIFALSYVFRIPLIGAVVLPPTYFIVRLIMGI
jgi:Zn-dependent protease